jgi:hypothetical protein
MKTISVKTAPVVSGAYKEKAIATSTAPSVIASASTPTQVAADRDMSLNIEVTPLPIQSPSDYVFREELVEIADNTSFDVSKSVEEYPLLSELILWNIEARPEDTLSITEVFSWDFATTLAVEDYTVEDLVQLGVDKPFEEQLLSQETQIIDFGKNNSDLVSLSESSLVDMSKQDAENLTYSEASSLQFDRGTDSEECPSSELLSLNLEIVFTELCVSSESWESFTVEENNLGDDTSFSELFDITLDTLKDESFSLSELLSISIEIPFIESSEALESFILEYSQQITENLASSENIVGVITPLDPYCLEDYFAEDYADSLPRFYIL